MIRFIIDLSYNIDLLYHNPVVFMIVNAVIAFFSTLFKTFRECFRRIMGARAICREALMPDAPAVVDEAHQDHLSTVGPVNESRRIGFVHSDGSIW